MVYVYLFDKICSIVGSFNVLKSIFNWPHNRLIYDDMIYTYHRQFQNSTEVTIIWTVLTCGFKSHNRDFHIFMTGRRHYQLGAVHHLL